MKSSAACYARRFGGVTFDENESSIVAPFLSEANSTTCHCHCPCDAFERDDGASSLSTACDLCERLRGQTGRCYDSVDRVDATEWTGDSHAADRSSRRKSDENDLSVNDSRVTVEKRDRTLKCDRTPLRESSARCASSVVRWIFAARFYADFKSIEWRRFLWIVLFIFAICNLAAANNIAIGPSRNKGENLAFDSLMSVSVNLTV